MNIRHLNLENGDPQHILEFPTPDFFQVHIAKLWKYAPGSCLSYTLPMVQTPPHLNGGKLGKIISNFYDFGINA